MLNKKNFIWYRKIFNSASHKLSACWLLSYLITPWKGEASSKETPYDVCLCVTKVVKTYVLFKNVCFFATRIFERSDIIFWAFFKFENDQKLRKFAQKMRFRTVWLQKVPFLSFWDDLETIRRSSNTMGEWTWCHSEVIFTIVSLGLHLFGNKIRKVPPPQKKGGRGISLNFFRAIGLQTIG